MARTTGHLPGLRFAWRAFCYALGAIVVALFVVQAWFFARVLWWNYVDGGTTAFMAASLDRLRESSPTASLDRQWVPYDRISAHLKRAVVAAEDAKFLEHEGFDWEAIGKAMRKNERKGRIVSGGSTISQQLAKNIFLSGDRSWLRKAQEAVITWMIETVMSKRRILEIYLNVVEWGDGTFGAEAAARRHFGVRALALAPAQAAWLASILPSPRRYDRGRSTSYLSERVATILARMPAAPIP